MHLVTVAYLSCCNVPWW